MKTFTILATVFGIAGCGSDKGGSEAGSKETQTEVESGEWQALSLKSGIKALALTTTGLPLTGEAESNLKALTADGNLETPWDGVVNSDKPIVFEQMFVTDEQVLLARPITEDEMKLTSFALLGEESGEDVPAVFEDVVLKPGEVLESFPGIVRIDRKTGHLQSIRTGTYVPTELNLTSKVVTKYGADRSGNLFYKDGSVIRKIDQQGTISTVVNKGARDFKVLGDGSLFVDSSDGDFWLRNGKQQKVQVDGGTIQWMESLGNNLYYGLEDSSIMKVTTGGVSSLFRGSDGEEPTNDDLPAMNDDGPSGGGMPSLSLTGLSVPGKFLLTAATDSKFWAVFENVAYRVYPSYETVATDGIEIESAVVFNDKLVVVGSEKVLIDGEEIGTYEGVASSVTIKESVLLIAAGTKIFEINLQSKEVQTKELGVELEKVSAL